MGLKNLAGLSLAKCNGTYALPPQKPKTKKADGFYLKDITHDISCSDVDDMIQAHKEREEAGGGQMDTDEATGTRDEEPPAKRPRSGTGRSAWRSSPKK